MTVASEVSRSGPYIGNGVTTIFPYTFKIASDQHISVIKRAANGVETTLFLGADYVVSDVGNAGGGSVALTLAPAVGQTVTFIRNAPFTQETDLQNQGAYYAETIENALDLSVMRDQELNERMNRALLLPATSDLSSIPFPSPEANKFLAWNADANAIVNKDAISASALPTGAIGEDLLAADTVDDVDDLLAVAVWPSARTLTMRERSKWQCHVLDFCAPHDTNANTSALRAWLGQAQSAGVAAIVGNDAANPQAFFVTEGELEITKPGQIVRWEQSPGYGYGSGALQYRASFQRGTMIKAAGTLFASAGERIRTRRLFRANTGAAQDPAYSCVFNIQAEGVQMFDPGIWLDCDYTNMAHNNYGADCDIGIFIGTRCGVQIHRPVIFGYFRKAGIFIDVTQPSAVGATRFPSLAGPAYSDGSVKNGADRGSIIGPGYIVGSHHAIAFLGAQAKAGQTTYTDQYFDAIANALITDDRGSFGASDWTIEKMLLTSVDHHARRRKADPTLSAGTLNTTSLHAEPDTMPAAVYIDGLAGNASGSIWGMHFRDCRISTAEAFRMRVRRGANISEDNCVYEGGGSGWLNTAGGAIDTGDYNTITYGDQAGETLTEHYSADNSRRVSKADGLGTHFYGTGFSYRTKGGRWKVGAYITTEGGELDLRADTYRWRDENAATIAQLDGSGQFNPQGGYVITSVAAANIAAIGHAINTTGKFTNKRVWDSTNNREMRASGSTAGSAWHSVGGGTTVTPA